MYNSVITAKAWENRAIIKNSVSVCWFIKTGLWKNEFEGNNEKSCSWSRNRVSHKNDSEAVWTHKSIPTAWELKNPKAISKRT